MREHIRNSNLIENVDSLDEDLRSAGAWFWLLGEDDLTESAVLKTHQMIMEKLLLPKHAGSYRHDWVSVGGRICPDPKEVPHLMENWLQKMQGWQNLEPTTMHVEFEHIHPFIDGNGRTGRMLWWWHETKLGKYPTLVEFENRFSYYNLF